MKPPEPFSVLPPSSKDAPRPASQVEQHLAASHSTLGGELAADLATLHEREANLRHYEVRLRAWQAQLDAAQAASGGSAPPFPRAASANPFVGEGSLEAAWAKFHRARALLEAEQNQMRDTRIALHETELGLKRREADLTKRETLVAERERALGIGPNGAAPSTVQRLAQAPLQAARAIFKGR